MMRNEDWEKGIAKIEIFINGEWLELHSFAIADKNEEIEPFSIENLVNDLHLDFDDSGVSPIDTI
ncbi:MAG: hypothetical protein AAF902_02030 [Chloroflexota bacterium]